MANFKARLTPELTRFIRRQTIFFTGSAATTGRINVSPKGIDTFRVLDDTTVGYLDLTGSGNETAAHVLNAGRLTIMFCSFEAKPLILRLYGRGEIVGPDTPAWGTFADKFPSLPGQRQIVLLHVESLQTSCGWGVPLMDNPRERPTLVEWCEKKGPAGVAAYQRKSNRISIDGLPTSIA